MNVQNLAGSVLANVNPNDYGRQMGQVFVMVLLLAGIAKCWSISQRSTTNKKCALSLLFILLPLLMGGAISIALPWINSTPAAFRAIIMGMICLTLFLLVAIAIVLGILGLLEISRQPGVYSQGRSQAIWAFVLSGLFAITFVHGFIRGLANSRATSPFKPTAQSGQILNYADLNFRFRAPERPWVTFNSAKLNKDAKVALIRRSPEIIFMVIAEKIGGTDFTSEQLAEMGKARFASAADNSRVLSERSGLVKDLPCVIVNSEGTLRGTTLLYQSRYIVTNGFAYQFIGYSREANQSQLDQELDGLSRGFELVDSGRLAVASGRNFSTNFVSPSYHYSASVENSPWRDDHNLAKQFPQAEFAASRGDSCFIVIPVSLNGQKPGEEHLTTGLLALFGIRYPDDNLRERRDYNTAAGLQGVQYDYEREIESRQFRYRLGIVRGGDTAYLVAAWTQRRQPEAKAILDDAVARVRFDNDASRPGTVREYTTQERKTQGYVLNQAALISYKASDFGQALPLFLAAAAANTGERQYAINALQTWIHLDRPREALTFINSRPTDVRRNLEIRAWEACFQAEDAMPGESITNYASIFAEGYRDESHLTRYVRLLNAQSRHAESLATLASYQKKGNSITARLLEAETCRLQNDLPKALSLLKQLREQAPYNLQITSAFVETALAAGLYNEALEASKGLAEKNRDSAYAQYLKGRSEFGLKWYREAKVSFEAAAKLAPADKSIASFLELVNNMMGEGGNSAVKETIEPVAMPLAWTKISSQPAPEGYATNYGAYYERRAFALSWKPGREYKSTEYFHLQVLDASGVSAYSTIQRRFDPVSEQLYVNEVRVLDREGKIVSRGNVANYYVLDERRDDIASHWKVLNIPVPGLQPGSQLVVTITRRQLGQITEFPFLEHAFSADIPVRESLVLLAGNTKACKYQSSPAREPEKLPEGLCWRWAEPVVARYEPYQPSWETFAATLWVADSSASWRGIASNYLASIAARVAPDPAVKEKARSLVSQAHNAAEKTAAIAAYVQTNFTYKAIEFGRRARIPNAPGEVMRNQYGDCKDHAVLLQQLLAAAGVPAHLALVATAGPVQPDLPSLDQFNHLMVFVPDGRGLFIDATDKASDPLSGSPIGLTARDALILDPQNPRFLKIPAPIESAGGMEMERHVRLENQESAEVRETIIARGIQAAYLRSFFQTVPAASRKMLFQKQMGLADVELRELAAEGVETPAAPLKIQCAYALKKQFHRADGRLSGVMRSPLERAYLAAVQVDNRSTPFELRIPLAIKSTVTLEVPAGFAARLPANPAAKLDSPFASSKSDWHLDGRNLVAEFQCRRATGNFKASDYADFRETMSRSLALVEKELILEDVQQAGR